MAHTQLGTNVSAWLAKGSICQTIIILSFALLHTGQLLACPDPDTPLPPPPDPSIKSELVCRYVYISYPDAGEEYLGEDLIYDVPSELQEFMNDQANGVFTFDIQALYVPEDSLKTWMSGRTTVDYLTPGAPMPFHDAGACGSGDVVAAEVHAEILTQILSTYDQLELPNPFANCDYIFFIHPVRMCEGHKGISSTLLKMDPYWNGLVSSVKGFHTDRSPTDYNLDIKQNLLELSAHEFGHNMGLFHPTGDKESDQRPSFGAYDMMRPLVLYTSTAGGRSGLYSYSTWNLINAGWLTSIPITTERTEVLYDAQSPNRNAIEIPLDNCGGQFPGERFILSYHNQTEYDGRHQSAGLQIWHELPLHFRDIEVASGRKSGDFHDDPDPEEGVDVLERPFWDPDDLDTDHNKTDTNFDHWYEGTSTDFFPIEVNDPDGVEFSYNTNPSTWGTESPEPYSPQSVRTTLFVRARYRDEESIFVDVYPMPREEITAPASGATVAVDGSPMTISWEHEFLNTGPDAVNVLDQVEIWFSPFNGEPFSYQHVGTADYTDTGFAWNPTGEHVTNQGKVKLVFTNDVNDNTAETIMEGTVSVTGTATPWENLIYPVGGEALYVDEPCNILWTSFNGVTPDQVDIHVSSDGGTTWQVVGLDVPYELDESDPLRGNAYFYPWTPSANHVGGQTRLKLVFHFSGGLSSESISQEDFSIYQVSAHFNDVTTTSGVDYEGTPYAAADLEYNGNNLPDMFVSIQACENCDPLAARSRLYSGSQPGSIGFVDRTQFDFAPGSSPQNESYGLSAADYDGDGDRDLFVTHPESPQLFNLDGGQFTDVIDDPTVFDPNDMPLLENSLCANWVDFDHDGDLDLYLGRALRYSTNGPDDSVATLMPLPDAVFQNTGSGVSFIEVGESLGLVNPSDPGVTMSTAWADMDGDGYWEVVVSDISGSNSSVKLFQEVPLGDYWEDGRAFPSAVDQSQVNSLQWVDFDRDNDLDLLMIRNENNSYALLNNNGQLNDCITLPGDLSWRATAGNAFDFDLDGYPDVAMANGQDGLEARLWQNLMGSPKFVSQKFVNVATKAGLTGFPGVAQGIFANDFNGDGDLDLFLGRQTTTGRIFQNENPAGGDTPKNHWLGFILTSAGSNTVIGATVTLETPNGQSLGIQMIDPGSGRGTQQPHQLVFGLGDTIDPVQVSVLWPSGREMSFPVAPSQFDQFLPVDEPTNFSIDIGSISMHSEVRPYSNNLDWVFTWKTDFWTEPSSDIVNVDLAAGSGCTFTGETLQDGVTWGVTTRIFRQVDPSTGAMTYQHEMRWLNRPCVVGCRYRFGVQSALGNTIESVSDTETDLIRFKICPSSN